MKNECENCGTDWSVHQPSPDQMCSRCGEQWHKVQAYLPKLKVPAEYKYATSAAAPTQAYADFQDQQLVPPRSWQHNRMELVDQLGAAEAEAKLLREQVEDGHRTIARLQEYIGPSGLKRLAKLDQMMKRRTS